MKDLNYMLSGKFNFNHNFTEGLSQTHFFKTLSHYKKCIHDRMYMSLRPYKVYLKYIFIRIYLKNIKIINNICDVYSLLHNLYL
jgi:hypothetical protein